MHASPVIQSYVYVGFSMEVDRQLAQAIGLDSGSCADWQKLVVLLMDEMYVREDLVYSKDSGRLVGFVDLGEINNHLLAFERKMKGEVESEPPLAKSIMAFMVRGLFTTLHFPYAHFPCRKVTGDLLMEPFWQAVYHLERMSLKVCMLRNQNQQFSLYVLLRS